MTEIKGFICVSAINFNCPYCNKEYLDIDEKYTRRANKNKCGYTKIKCECSERFGVTCNMKSDVVSFKLKYQDENI